jgi:AraC family ethanolamine operon transcriptional activator
MTSHSFSFSPVAFDDVDHFREWSKQQGWELESRQLSNGPNRIKFDHLAFPELVVSHHRVRQMMYDVFDVPSGHVVFAICRAKLPVVWCGQDLPPSLLAILRPVRTYWVRLPAGWETYEFTVSEELIRRTELFPPKFFEKTIRLEQAFLPLVEPQTGQFLKRMDFYFQMVKSARGVTSEVVRHIEFYNFLLHGLQQVIDAGLAASPTGLPRPTRRADLVEKARDLMIADPKLDLTADEIAQSLGVSYRVLNYACQSNLGISPYQYLLTEKLHAVRRKLKTSDASVTEACLSYGFSTPSRFARQYKRLFGELPSQTRNRSWSQLKLGTRL